MEKQPRIWQYPDRARVLIVDDNVLIRGTLRRVLESAGYDYSTLPVPNRELLARVIDIYPVVQKGCIAHESG